MHPFLLLCLRRRIGSVCTQYVTLPSLPANCRMCASRMWLTFLSICQAPIVLSVQLPNVPEKPEWNLNGAIATIEDIPLKLLISSLRDRIIAHVKANIPAGRIRLSFRNKVLTNANTLASYNMDDDDLILMTLKDPPKKKK